MPKPIYTFYDECAVNPCKSRSAFHAAKLQLFHKPTREWMIFLFYRGTSSHVMPTPACAMAGICGCGFSCPFFLIRKDQRIKADIKGLPHLATAPPPCRPGPRAQPGQGLAFPLSVSVVVASFLYGTLPPLAVIAGLPPFKGGARRAVD